MSEGEEEGGPEARKPLAAGHEDTTTGTGLQQLTNNLALDKLCKICVIILLGIEITGSDMLLLV